MTVPPRKGYNAYYDKNKRRDDTDSNDQNRKRFKSEAPLSQQLRNASPSNPDHRRRIRALQGIAPDDDDEQDTQSMRPPTTQKRSYKERQGHGASSNSDASNYRSGVPDLGDILNNFKVPESPRVFKSEPVDIDLWDSMLAQKSRPRKQKQDKQNTTERPLTAAQEIPRETPEVYSGRNAQAELTAGTMAQSKSPEIVDLTADDRDYHHGETSSRPLTAKAPTHAPTQTLPQALTAAQVHLMDQTDVPQNIKQQAIDIYQREGTALPTGIEKWAQLKTFVAQHPASFISTHLCLLAQAHAYHAATAASLSQVPLSPVHNNATTPRSVDSILPLVASVGSNNTRGHHGSPEMPRIKIETEEPVRLYSHPVHQEEAATQQPPHRRTSSASRRNSNRLESPPRNHNTALPTQLPTTQSTTTTPPSAAVIRQLCQPSSLFSEILPPTGPPNAPHLISLWDEILLSLPLEQHSHLSVPDTVVSILAKYDLSTGAVVRAFLDVKGVNHFFFLFKSRGGLHSWSIEREGHVITIGIERPTRALNLNTTDQSQPSSGQYDLTIQYRMVPFSSPGLDPAASTGEVSSPEYITAADVDQRIASISTSGPNNIIPHHWVLLNTSIFPSQPPLFTFLHHTPPSRGADTHEIYSHPSQTSQLPASHLSMFARYMQQTAFTTSVMDAEVQVAFGRKVRYDSVLGRVRVLWDYALRGARTQREKRERGEYNRPRKEGVGGGSGSGKGGVPGLGISKGYLAGDGGGGSVVGETDGFVVGEGGARGEYGAGVQGEDEERVRKRVKMEGIGMREERGESGSEYSDGSEGE